MSARTHIIVPKHLRSATDWRKGAVPKKNAPFLKAPLVHADSWNWKEATLEDVDSKTYRLLVLYRADGKPNYKAWLSHRLEDGDYTLVCRYESHGTHGGRHCHFVCYSDTFPLGEIEPENLKSFPYWRNSKQEKLGLMSLNEAWNKALKFYRIGASESGGLV